jgi:hypothetical protein
MQTARSWRRWLPVVAVGVALGGLWALTMERPADAARAAAEPRAAPPDRHEATVSTPEGLPPAAAATPAAPDRDLPPGVSREQWAAIEAETTHRADGPAELQRLRSYLEWSDALRRFREARQAGAPAADLAALAQSLDDGLSERIRLTEVSAAEARQIKGATLEVTLADEALRAERLRQWAATELAPAHADPRQATFEQRQGEIVAAWSALPAAARDRAALERELEGLRQQTFSAASR